MNTTPIALDGPRLDPASGGVPKRLVILLHGYGADGNDLIGLGREWAAVLPDAAFVSPNAPQILAGSPLGGRQWFPLRSMDENELRSGVETAHAALRAFIEAESLKLKLPFSAIALVGFSQGTMMALHTGLRLSQTLAAIVGFSGHLAGAEKLEAEITARPPVLLIHGSADEVVPSAALHAARNALSAVGVNVQWQMRPGLGHGIDGAGLEAAGAFLKSAFADR